MRSPFTGVVFALELTHDVNMLLPLLVAVDDRARLHRAMLRRSILTEKVEPARLSPQPRVRRRSARDPLRARGDAHRIVTLRVASPLTALTDALRVDPAKGPQRLYPVVDNAGHLLGVVPRVDLQRLVDDPPPDTAASLAAITRLTPMLAFPDEPLRVIVHRMAETGLTRFPVVDRASTTLIGVVALDDLLKARAQNLDSERRRERMIRFEDVVGLRVRSPLSG